MKVITGFKEGIRRLGREIDAKITYYADGSYMELGASQLNSVTSSYEGTILKSYMKKLEIDSNMRIPLDTNINYLFGLKIEDDYRYINFGHYIVNKVEKQEDTNSWIITCYDKMLYSMKDYEALEITYPCTIREYIVELARKLGLEFKNYQDEFVNYDKEIQNELFIAEDGNSLGYTYRDVLDQLAEVTGSIICIDEQDRLEIRYPTETNDVIDEHYLKDINVKFGEKYGPVNSIVLSRSAESDNIYLSDEESIELNGLTEIKIKDNQFMNFNDRDQYLPDLLEKLDGLEFYINDFSSTGIVYYDLYDFYTVRVFGDNFKCLMLNDTIEVTQGLSEDIYTELPEKTETDYSKSDKTDNRINRAYIIVNKQTQEIEALTSKVSALGDGYTKEEVNQLIQNAETGLTNKFITNGGNNIFRNTGLWFEDNSQIDYLYPQNTMYPDNELFLKADPYFEYWSGKVVRGKEDKASNQNCLILQNTTLSQNQKVRNGIYTISFMYKKLINLATARVIINGEETELTSIEDTEFVKTINVTSQLIDIKFICDTNNGVEIYDLMGNPGSEKAEYSQHQNETTTSTVNISKGITITSSDTNTTFKADSDGIRVFNSRDLETPITDFTEIGMDTKKAIIEDEAEIVEVLFKKVGNNTWITKL